MQRLHGALRIRTDRGGRFDEARQRAARDDVGARPQLTIDLILVPHGSEERAVRRGLARVRSSVRVIGTGIGPHAASRAAAAVGGHDGIRTALIMGLCGLLRPAFFVAEPLVYGDVARDGEPALALDAPLASRMRDRLGDGTQSGVRALERGAVVTKASEKRALAARSGRDVVDMETYTLARSMHAEGVTVAAVRVGSDAVHDDLPALERALDGSGGIDAFALALAMMRRPAAATRLARNATRALAVLERSASLLG